jgi:hypothetical protein
MAGPARHVQGSSRRGVRRALAALSAVASALVAVAAAAQSTEPALTLEAAASPALVAAYDGAYDFRQVDGPRECRLRLTSEAALGDVIPGARRIVLPSGCLTTFPILRDVRAWGIAASGDLLLLDRNGFLAFAPRRTPENLLAIVDAAGRIGHVMVPVDSGWAEELAAALAASGGGQSAAPAGPAVDPGDLPPGLETFAPAALEGWYVVFDARGAETGCRLALLSAPALVGGAKASGLDSRCRDPSMIAFAPRAWRIVEGRLRLLGVAGRELELAPTGERRFAALAGQAPPILLRPFE